MPHGVGDDGGIQHGRRGGDHRWEVSHVLCFPAVFLLSSSLGRGLFVFPQSVQMVDADPLDVEEGVVDDAAAAGQSAF